jgi:hypothetical protein
VRSLGQRRCACASRLRATTASSPRLMVVAEAGGGKCHVSRRTGSSSDGLVAQAPAPHPSPGPPAAAPPRARGHTWYGIRKLPVGHRRTLPPSATWASPTNAALAHLVEMLEDGSEVRLRRRG